MSPLWDTYPLRVQVESITPPLNLLFDLGEAGGGQRRVCSLHTEAAGRACRAFCIPRPKAERGPRSERSERRGWVPAQRSVKSHKPYSSRSVEYPISKTNFSHLVLIHTRNYFLKTYKGLTINLAFILRTTRLLSRCSGHW